MRRRAKLILLWAIVVLSLASCYYFHAPVPSDPQVAYLEDYLVDFSQKVQGHILLNGPLPPDLDTPKFFAILDPYYQNKEPMEKVKSYPVRVFTQEESYVLILCDKESRFIVYKDLGQDDRFCRLSLLARAEAGTVRRQLES